MYAASRWAVDRLASAAQRWRDRSPRAVLTIGFAGFLLYAVPGYMSSDSFVQLMEARTHYFTAAHPPVMAAVWLLADAIVSGPLLMLLLQGGLALAGLYGVLRRVLDDRRAATAAVAVLWFPPVLTTMAVIWKDSQMAGALLAGFAALTSERRGTRVLGLLAMTYACAVRYNALAAAVPIVGLWFTWSPGWGFWRRYTVASAACIVMVVVAFGANRLIAVEPGEMSAASGTAVADIIGVLRYTTPRSDDELLERLSDAPLVVRHDIQAYARHHYSPRNSYWATHGEEQMFWIPLSEREERGLVTAWRGLVASDWRAYRRHRVAQYRELLGLSNQPLWAAVYASFVERSDHPPFTHHDARPSRIQSVLAAAFVWLAQATPLYRPWLYAVLALVLLVGLCRDRLTFALLASGLLYELSFLPAAGTPDSRYSHWLFTTTAVAVIALTARRCGVPQSAGVVA